MSKRCALQKEYYKEFGNYKGNGKYSDDYVKWLENEVLALRVVGQIEQLVCDCIPDPKCRVENNKVICNGCNKDRK